MQNFEYGLKISFIILWNTNWAFFKTKGMTFHSYYPKGTVNAVLYMSFGSICVCQNPDFISNLENTIVE